MDAPMAFNQAMFSLADGWLLYWFYRLGYSIVLTPLFVYLLHRDWRGEMGPVFRVVMWLFIVSPGISLAFDYVDVVRYLLGARERMI